MNMTNDSKLKTIIREEREKVNAEILKSGSTHGTIITKWLQSLQRIEDYCKERNRY